MRLLWISLVIFLSNSLPLFANEPFSLESSGYSIVLVAPEHPSSNNSGICYARIVASSDFTEIDHFDVDYCTQNKFKKKLEEALQLAKIVKTTAVKSSSLGPNKLMVELPITGTYFMSQQWRLKDHNNYILPVKTSSYEFTTNKKVRAHNKLRLMAGKSAIAKDCSPSELDRCDEISTGSVPFAKEVADIASSHTIACNKNYVQGHCDPEHLEKVTTYAYKYLLYADHKDADRIKGVDIAEEACLSQGDAMACQTAGVFLSNDKDKYGSVRLDFQRSRPLFRKACSLGSEKDCSNLKIVTEKLEAKRIAEEKKAKEKAAKQASGESWGNLIGQVVKHGTGAVIASGAVEDIEAIGALTAANAYAGLATGDNIQSIEAEQKGLIDSHLQKRLEQQQFTASLNEEVNQIREQRQSLADENQRLKLELENARMKAELARLNGGQSGNSVVTPRGQSVERFISQNDVKADTIDENFSKASGRFEAVPVEEPVSRTYAVCWQGKGKIVPGNQQWFCDGRIQATWATDKTIDVGLRLVGCDNPLAMTTTVKGFEPGDIQYIFTCSNPYKKYERDILAQYNLSGGDYTYYKPQQSVASELAGVIGYENAEYSPGKIIAALPPQEGNDQ